jgi:tetratricopeptide (TPR) repeat protein
MRRLFPLLLLALGLPAFAEDPPLKGVAACNKALKLIDDGKPAEALVVLEAAKGTMDPEDEWLWWGNKGQAYWDLRQDDKALENFRKSIELKKDCWFRVPCANLLFEFGKYDEALAILDGPGDKDYAERAKRLRVVIEGPYRKRWPHAYKKLEYSGKAFGHYNVVSDVGVDAAEMDKVEAEAAKLNPADKIQAFQLEKLLKPSPDLVNVFNLLELTRKEYLRITGVTEAQWPKGKICRVFFLKTQKEFLEFAKAVSGEDEHENLLGFYDPNFKYIQLFNQPGGGEVCGIHAETLDTFWHEGWHQVFDALTSQHPTWLNEGIAEFLGKGDVSDDGSKLTLGKLVTVEARFVSRYERIKEILKEKKHVPFREFFKYEHEQWDKGDVLAHYAQAWAVVYYAMKGDNEALRKDFRKLLQELLKGTRWQDAMKAIFTDAKLDDYEAKWRAFMEKLE